MFADRLMQNDRLLPGVHVSFDRKRAPEPAVCAGINRRGVVNEESRRKGVATYPARESCVVSRKLAIGALTRAHVGWCVFQPS